MTLSRTASPLGRDGGGPSQPQPRLALPLRDAHEVPGTLLGKNHGKKKSKQKGPAWQSEIESKEAGRVPPPLLSTSPEGMGTEPYASEMQPKAVSTSRPAILVLLRETNSFGRCCASCFVSRNLTVGFWLAESAICCAARTSSERGTPSG